MRIRIGCTGWAYDDWKGPFYPVQAPASEFLERYAQVFDYTEVDSSFYGPPTPETTAKWAAATPPGFLFSLKVPGAITHEKRLHNVDAEVEQFTAALDPLRRAGKLGPIVLQLPPFLTRAAGEADLARFLAAWPRDVRLAVEFRDASWWCEPTYDALRAHGAALAWSISHHATPPAVRTADFLYLRFVGDRQLTRFDRVQRDLSPIVRQWSQALSREQAMEAFAVVNNHFMGFAPASARVVAQALGQPVPDLEKAKRRRHQAGLGSF